MTISELTLKVREASFDRYPMQQLYLKKTDSPSWRFSISDLGVKIVDTANNNLEKFFLPKANYTYIKDVVAAIDTANAQNNLGLSYAKTFGYNENLVVETDIYPMSSLLSEVLSINAKFWVTTEMVREVFYRYLVVRKIIDPRYYDINAPEIDEALGTADYHIKNHIIWWCSFYIVEKRRLIEMANNLSDVVFTNDSSSFSGYQATGITKDFGSLNVQLADVFSLQVPDIASVNNQAGMSKNSVGDDNLLGDAGFWWKLQMYLRALLERDYSDFSLRPNQIMTGQMWLDKESNINAHYDTFPYEIYTRTRPIRKNS